MQTIKTYIRDKYIKKDGTAAIYVCLYLQGKKVRINTGVCVLPSQYDAATSQVILHPQAPDLNSLIDKVKTRVHDIVFKYQFNGATITPQILISEYRTPSGGLSFIDFMAQQIKNRSGLLQPSTLRSHQAILSKLKEYNPRLQFNDFSQDMLDNLQKFLKNSRGNNINTIHNAIKTIKTYYLKAYRLRLVQHYPFERYRVKRAAVHRVYLSLSELRELKQLYAKKYLPPAHQAVLRWFLFSCFTGLRISDIKALQHDYIINKHLHVPMRKTSNVNASIVVIPLTKYTLSLITDESPHRCAGPVFNTFHENTINKLLKDITPVVGIEKSVSFHAARHTFGTLFIESTNDVAALQKLMGHTNVKQTMDYVHISQAHIRAQIEKFCGD